MTESIAIQFRNSQREKGLFFALDELCDEVGIPGSVEHLVAEEYKGTFDVFDAVVSDADRADWKKDGWRIGHWFGEFLLKVNAADMRKVLSAAKAIALRHDGESMCSYYVGRYLDMHSDEAEHTAEMTLADGNYLDFIPFVLPRAIRENPERWLNELIAWIGQHDNANSRLAGLLTMGAIDETTVAAVSDTIVMTVLGFVNKSLSYPDPKRYAIAQYRLCIRWSTRDHAFTGIVSGLLSAGENGLLAHIALMESSDTKSQTEAVIDERLKAFASSLKATDGYFDSLDGYLAHLALRFPMRVIDFLTDVFQHKRERPFEKGAFSQTFDALANSQGNIRDVVVTRWLASDQKSLWFAAMKLVGESRCGRDLGIVVSEKDLPDGQVARINFFRRSMGFLFSAHVTCVGFIISCIPYLDDNSLRFIAEDFYDVVTMNFPDVVETYVKSYPGLSAKMNAFLSGQLARRSKLGDALKAAGDVYDVMPPLDNRLEFAKISAREQREIYEQALSQSVLSALTTRTTVLFGNGMISETYANGSKQRAVVPMSRTETRVRVPALMYAGELMLQAKLDELRYMEVREK